MKFYEKYYQNNYDELITYYPRFYRNVFEMVEILKAQGRILDGIEQNIEQTYLNGFIDYADEATISKLESFLKIGQNKNRTLEERRRLVKSYFVGSGKISASKIYQMIAVYTDSPVICKLEPFDDEGNNRLYIEIQSNEEETICTKDIFALLSKKIPANLVFCLADRLGVETPVPVNIESGLRMISTFYPRDNIPPFYLDGIAGLDGEYYLDGFLSGESLDFYPVVLQIGADVSWQMKLAGMTRMQSRVQLDVQNDMIFRLWGAVLTGGTVAGKIQFLFDAHPKTALNAEILVRAYAIQFMDVKTLLYVQGAAAMKAIASGGLHLAGEIQAKNAFDGKITARTEIIQTLTSRESLTLAGEIYAEKNLTSRLYFAGGIDANTKVNGEITVQAQAVQNMEEDTSFLTQSTIEVEESICAKELRILGEAGETVSIAGGLRIEKNWGTLDGSELLDGSRMLDAKVYTEEI